MNKGKSILRGIICLIGICVFSTTLLACKCLSTKARDYEPDEYEGESSFQDKKEKSTSSMGLGIIPGHYGDELFEIKYLGISEEDKDFYCDYDVRAIIKNDDGEIIASSEWYGKNDTFSLLFYVPEGEIAHHYDAYFERSDYRNAKSISTWYDDSKFRYSRDYYSYKMILSPVEISLDTDAESLTVGEKYSIKLSCPGIDVDYSLKSSNEKVIEVNKGSIKAIKAGSAVVSCTVNGAKGPSLTIKVEDKIKINATKITLYVGQRFPLYLTQGGNKIKCDSGALKGSNVIAWLNDGTVIAKKKGKAVITMLDDDGNKYTCNVKVRSASIKQETAEIAQGTSLKLGIPKGVKVKSFESSKKSVATVTDKGKITALKEGKTNITIKCADGQTYTCKVTVCPPVYTTDELSKLISVKLIPAHTGTYNNYVTFRFTNNTPYTIEALDRPYANGYSFYYDGTILSNSPVECKPGKITEFIAYTYKKENAYIDGDSKGEMAIRVNGIQYNIEFDTRGNTEVIKMFY